MKVWLGVFIYLSALLFMVYPVFAEKTSVDDCDYIFKLKNDGIMLADINDEDLDIDVVSDNLNIYKSDFDTVKKLKERGMIEYAEEDSEIWLADDSEKNLSYNDPYFSDQWYFETHNLNYAKEVLGTGKNVRVGILDSGVTLHPDFNADNIEKGYNYKDPDRTGNDVSQNKDLFVRNHGTSVAGIICAQNNNEFGTVGIAEDVTIVPLVVYLNGGKVSDVIKAIEGAVDDYDCDVINMSLTSDENKEGLQEVINYADEKNVIIVAAVGNNHGSDYLYPATCENVIGVGAVDKNLNVPDFSQKNRSVDVSAAGVNITLADSLGEYVIKQGTSFSAPIITGFAALLKEKYPDMNNELFLKALKAGSVDIKTLGYDVYTGFGLFDAKESIRFLDEEYDFFISPVSRVCTEDDDVFEAIKVKVFGEDIEGYLNFVIYDENGITQIVDKRYFKTENDLFCEDYWYVLPRGGTIKIFAFDNFFNMRPLGKTRIIDS